MKVILVFTGPVFRPYSLQVQVMLLYHIKFVLCGDGRGARVLETSGRECQVVSLHS